MTVNRKAALAILLVAMLSCCVIALAGCGSDGSDSSSDASSKAANASQASYSPISITLFNDDVEFELASTNGWSKDGKAYIQFNMNVENQGEDVDSWSLDVPFNGDLVVSDSWDCQCVVDGSTLTITNDQGNGSLEKGQSAKGAGFIVCGDENLGIFM